MKHTEKELVSLVDFSKVDDKSKNKEINNYKYWLKVTGYDRYFEIISMIMHDSNANRVDYYELKQVVKYDYNLSKFLYAKIKDYENVLKAELCNGVEIIKINNNDVEEVKNKIVKVIKGNIENLDKDVNIRLKDLESTFSVYEFFCKNSLNVAYKFWKTKVDIVKNKSKIESIEKLISLRNEVYHNDMLLNNDDLKFKIHNLYSLLPKGSLRDRFKGDLKVINKKYQTYGREYLKKYIVKM